MGTKAGSDPKSRSQGNQGAGNSQQNSKVVKKPKKSDQKYEFDEFISEESDQQYKFDEFIFRDDPKNNND